MRNDIGGTCEKIIEEQLILMIDYHEKADEEESSD